MSRSLLIAILAFGTSAIAQPSVPQALVVVAPTSGSEEETPNERVAFFPAQVVRVIAANKNFVLVRRDDDRRSAWLPRAVLADASSFRPVRYWDGESRFEVSSASGDSSQTYHFKRDGTFSVEFDDNHSARRWSGRLYRNGQVIWARRASSSMAFDHWSVFQRLPNQRLCMLNFDTPAGCECVGTYNSASTAPCK